MVGENNNNNYSNNDGVRVLFLECLQRQKSNGESETVIMSHLSGIASCLRGSPAYPWSFSSRTFFLHLKNHVCFLTLSHSQYTISSRSLAVTENYISFTINQIHSPNFDLFLHTLTLPSNSFSFLNEF